MLDIGFHQAAGLHGFAPHAHLRVLAVASQDDGGAAAPETLWQVCAHLQRSGYPVVVLDGTASESAASPGLLNLLLQAHWSDDAAGLHGGGAAASLAVIPSAKGMLRMAQQASRTGDAPLPCLLPYLRRYGLVVLHAPAVTLAPLLTHSATVPLVIMDGGAAGVLASYQSVKLIAVHAGLPCMVAALVKGGTPEARRKAQGALQTLQDCARRHLGGAVHTTTTIAASNPQDLQRLALQLLENAGTIHDALTAPLSGAGMTTVPAHLVRSH